MPTPFQCNQNWIIQMELAIYLIFTQIISFHLDQPIERPTDTYNRFSFSVFCVMSSLLFFMRIKILHC